MVTILRCKFKVGQDENMLQLRVLIFFLLLLLWEFTIISFLSSLTPSAPKIQLWVTSCCFCSASLSVISLLSARVLNSVRTYNELKFKFFYHSWIMISLTLSLTSNGWLACDKLYGRNNMDKYILTILPKKVRRLLALYTSINQIRLGVG